MCNAQWHRTLNRLLASPAVVIVAGLAAVALALYALVDAEAIARTAQVPVFGYR